MYQLKQIPEDFIVDEMIDLDLSGGNYSCYKMKKRGISTFFAIDLVARSIKTPSSKINVAGLKDKEAVTTQMVSIYRGPRKDLDFRDFHLEYLGDSPKRINLGTNTGNRFKITVRNIDKSPKKLKKVLNLYGEQRFGLFKDNHVIGRLLIQKKFKDAFDILEKREDALKDHDNKADAIGGLRKLGKKILQFYISAYRSYLWNECVQLYIQKGGDQPKFPLLGFDSERTGLQKEIIDDILAKENIGLRSFILREFPELTSDQQMRDIYMPINDLDIGSLEDDDMNPGMKKILLDFWLIPGSYATVAIYYLFK